MCERDRERERERVSERERERERKRESVCVCSKANHWFIYSPPPLFCKKKINIHTHGQAKTTVVIALCP